MLHIKPTDTASPFFYSRDQRVFIVPFLLLMRSFLMRPRRILNGFSSASETYLEYMIFLILRLL